MNCIKIKLAALAIGTFFSGFFSTGVHAQKPTGTQLLKKTHYYIVIGSYTKAPGDKGIAVYDFDLQTGALHYRSAIGGIESPSYLAVSRNGKKLYAVSEKENGPGSIGAFQFDAASGMLKMINQAGSGGEGPCYISADDAGTHVIAANYGSGSLGVVRLNKDGSLDSASLQSIQQTGSSINKESQTGPHSHSAVLSPDNRYLLGANLGNDRVYVYRFDASADNPLLPANPGWVTVAPGSGPRHICFHPNGRYVYVVSELAGSVDAFDYKDGVLSHKQTVTMLPDGFTGTVEAADIHISPDGKFLYASNREVRNEIVIYSIDASGSLAFVGRQPVLGKAPRNFVIDPTGKFLLVGDMNTNEVIVFRRNDKTGLLAFTGEKISINSPACLKFVGKMW